MEVKDYTNRTSTFWFFKGRHTSSNFPVSHPRSSQPNEKSEEAENIDVISVSDSVMKQRKPLGWRAMPFILGNETFERLGSWGIAANFQLYLMIKYNMTMYSVAMLAQWNSLNNFLTVVGAFVADAYTGKFPTIVFGSIATMLGMVMVTLTAVVPNLLPPQCTDIERHQGQCTGPNNAQLAFLYLALCLLAIGGGAIRPCSIPFAVDQFDSTTDRGRKDINSFFNWYYTSFTIILLITSTVVAYVQNHHWGWGFAIPTICMAFSLILLFVGTRIYIYVKPEGSVFSSIVQVPVAAYKKRRLQLPVDGIVDRVFYDPPRKKISIASKLPLSSRFRFLNKAAIIEDTNDIKADGCCKNPWRLCSIQQVEEVKCLINITPVWASSIISFISFSCLAAGSSTFLVAQSMKMDRHLGPNFQIPPPSISVISLIVMGIFLPIYDLIIVPALENINKQDGGITLLQRIGLGNICSILATVVAGFVERKRRASAVLHAASDGVAPISVMWLAPQLILMGFFEVFAFLGFVEFYNKQFPENMRSIGNSLVFLSSSVATYSTTLLVKLVHRCTGKDGQPDWLTDDINAGKLDYFYFLLAGLLFLNFMYFLFAASRYQYKVSGKMEVEPDNDKE